MSSFNNGLSLIAVVAVMLIVAVFALIIASFMSFGNTSAIMHMQSEQAFYIASAGVEVYIKLLEGDLDWSTPPVFADQVFGAGTLAVTYANQAVNEIDIISSGSVIGWDGNLIRRVIIQHFTRTGGGYIFDAPIAFSYGIHCFGSVVDFRKSSGTINGDVASRVRVRNYDSMVINGLITQNSAVANPGPVAMADYLAIANVVQPGSYTFNAGTYGSPGNEQIYYIKGNVTIQSNVVIFGTIIADGQVNVSNKSNIQIVSALGYPAIISGNSISISGLSNSSIDGLIYTPNNVTLDGLNNVTMNTCIIAGGNVSIQNGSNFTINHSDSIFSNPPPYFSGYSKGSIAAAGSLWREML